MNEAPEEPQVVIYGLKDPRDGQIRYVGQTSNLSARFAAHLSEAKNCAGNAAKSEWISSLLGDGLSPEVVTLESATQETCGFKEREWISRLGQDGRLFNLDHGCDVRRGERESREDLVSYRLTAAERRLIEMAAAKRHLRPSDYSRAVTLVDAEATTGVTLAELEAAPQPDPPKPRRKDRA